MPNEKRLQTLVWGVSLDGNTTSLGRYLVTIRRNGRITYDRESQTYAIHPNLTYETVAKTAEGLLKQQGHVHYFNLLEAGIVGNPNAIRRYITLWGQKNKLKSKEITLTGKRHARVYYQGQPPMLAPKEVILEAIGQRTKVSHKYLHNETDLPDRAIAMLMGKTYLGWERQATPRGVFYATKK